MIWFDYICNPTCLSKQYTLYVSVLLWFTYVIVIYIQVICSNAATQEPATDSTTDSSTSGSGTSGSGSTSDGNGHGSGSTKLILMTMCLTIGLWLNCLFWSFFKLICKYKEYVFLHFRFFLREKSGYMYTCTFDEYLA